MQTFAKQTENSYKVSESLTCLFHSNQRQVSSYKQLLHTKAITINEKSYILAII